MLHGVRGCAGPTASGVHVVRKWELDVPRDLGASETARAARDLAETSAPAKGTFVTP